MMEGATSGQLSRQAMENATKNAGVCSLGKRWLIYAARARCASDGSS